MLEQAPKDISKPTCQKTHGSSQASLQQQQQRFLPTAVSATRHLMEYQSWGAVQLKPGSMLVAHTEHEAGRGQGCRGVVRLTGNGPANAGSKSGHSPLHSSCHPLECRRPSQAQSSRTLPSGDLCGYLHAGTADNVVVRTRDSQQKCVYPETLASWRWWDPLRVRLDM